MVRYKENDLSSYNDNPLGLLPSRFIANSRNNLNVTGIFVCILRLLAYYPVWLLLNYTEKEWYFNNAPFIIVFSLIFGLLNYTLYILISFGDPGFLRCCPSTKLRPVDKIRDPYRLKFSLELRDLDNLEKGVNNTTSDIFGSSNDENEEFNEFDVDLENMNENKLNLEIMDNSINMSNFDVIKDRKQLEEVKNFNLDRGSSSLLNNRDFTKSPIRIDKSTANLSLVMESAPSQILHSIGVSQFSLNNHGILDSLLNNNESKNRFNVEYLEDITNIQRDIEVNYIEDDEDNKINNMGKMYSPNVDVLSDPLNEGNLDYSKSEIFKKDNLVFPLSPCSSDGIDLLPRREISGNNIQSSCFQSNDGFFVFKDGKMYQNGVRLRFCDYCRMYQPLRTKHCSSCERCIRTHDHHCPWLGVCIGEYNRCKFWWLSVIQFPECIWILYCIYLCIFKIELINRRPSLFDICAMIFIAGNALFIAFLSLLLVVYHFFLAYNNLTTWENLAWNKISYLKPFPDTQNSPFSKGYVYNIAIFCIPYYVDDLIIGDEGEIIWERNFPNKINR